MLSFTRSTTTRKAINNEPSQGISRMPKDFYFPIQALFNAESLKSRLTDKTKIPQHIFDLLNIIDEHEKTFIAEKDKKGFHKERRKHLLGKKLALLADLELELLALPLSKLPSATEDNKVITHLFEEASSERRKTQKSYDNYFREYGFPYCFTNDGTFDSGIDEAWPFIQKCFPELMTNTDELGQNIKRVNVKHAPASLSSNDIAFFPNIKNGNTLASSPLDDQSWHFAPNYLMLLWQIGRKKSSSKKLKEKCPIDTLINLWLGLEELDLEQNPFFENHEINSSTDYPSSSPESEPELPFDLTHTDWLPLREPDEIPKGDINPLKLFADQRASMFIPNEELALLEHPLLLNMWGPYRTYGFNKDKDVLVKLFHSIYSPKDVKRNLLAQQFMNIIGKRSLATKWGAVEDHEEIWKILRQRMDDLPRLYDQKMSKEMGFDKDTLKGFDVMDMINRRALAEQLAANAPVIPQQSDSGQPFDFWYMLQDRKDFRQRFKEHEWPHYNDLRELDRVKCTVDSGEVGLIGLQGGKFSGEAMTAQQQVVKNAWYWFAQGEAMMQAILMGNLKYQVPPSSHCSDNEKPKKTLLLNGMIHPYAKDDSDQIVLFNEAPQISEIGYQHFAKKLIYKRREDMPDAPMLQPDLVNVITHYIFRFLNLSKHELTYPQGPKHYKMDHGFHLSGDINGYRAQVNGMLNCLISVYEKAPECLAFAEKMTDMFDKEREILHKLVQVVVKIVDHFGITNLKRTLHFRMVSPDTEEAGASAYSGSVLLRMQDYYRNYSYDQSTCIIRTTSGGKNYLLIIGILWGDFYTRTKNLIEKYGDIDGIIIIDVPGTRDLAETEKLAKYIYQKNMTVTMPSGTVAISGGCDLFMGGKPSVMFHPEGSEVVRSTKLGIHSWSNRQTGEKGSELPKDHPKHQPHITFMSSVGLSPEIAEKFYFFNLQTPPEKIHYMNEEELRHFGICILRAQKPNEPFSVSMKNVLDK
ncbi:hypothetical protein [Aureibacter tunicatorum]|uniref:Uncharacterized protein n=1 Tax=Aureibacter tunicatorum TaxID=866807 RepID=A0AAE3XIX3_9BACT|nr:hypothetical protein [Aureibacter tunicatorum]MDR6237558.1 hypothetical protein [Aureibacter tunicatorum]BDD02592.1 hypothetical protein AUTU_00750 [Aureibacter tunicatorum]